MLGVYLTAAELTSRGYIVSPTSRSAAGADLLVVDEQCRTAWSIQVKAQRQAANYWLVGEQATKLVSPTHIYVFVNLRANKRPDYLVVPSSIVANKAYSDRSSTGSIFHCFDKAAGKEFITGLGWPDERQEGWETFTEYPLGYAPLPTPNHVTALLTFIPLLDRLTREELIHWRGGEMQADGVFTLPYAEYAKEVDAFVQVLYALGFILKFDWGEWEAQAYFGSSDLLDNADLETCVKLLTTHVRQDRFSDGHLVEMIANGHILSILRRLEVISTSR